MIYGYIRVSSKTQEDNGSRQTQLQQIIARAKIFPDQEYVYNEPTITKDEKGRDIEVYDEDNTIVHEIISGNTEHTKRPELMKIYNRMESGDILLISKIDRLARNQKELLSIVDNLRSRNIGLIFLDLGLDLNQKDANGRYNYVSEMMLQMMGSIAQMERDRIYERMEEGRRVAMERQRVTGKKIFGRPKTYDQDRLNYAVELLHNHSYSEVVKKTGISKSTIIREVRRLRALEEAETLAQETK